MSQSETLTYLAFALTAAAYWAYNNRLGLLQYLSGPNPQDPAARPDADTWRQEWVQTLMNLQQDLELEGAECCVPLVRELVWRLLGGEPNDVTARATKK